MFTSKKLKTIVASILTGAVIVGGIVTGYKNQPEPQPLTWDEYKLLQSVYEIELKKLGGVELKNVKSKSDYYLQLHEKMRRREPIEDINVAGTNMPAGQYKLLRDALFAKYETQL